MRIAIVADSYHPTIDGMVTVTDTFKKSLEKLGHEVFIIAPDPGEEHRREGIYYFPSIKYSGYEGYYLPIYPSNKIELFEKLKPDVIHAQGLTLMALKGFISAHTLKIPFIVMMGTMVTDTLEYYLPIKNLPIDLMEKLAWIYLRNLMNHADGVITPTTPIMKEIGEHGVSPRDGRVITAGIDTDMFSPMDPPKELIEELGLEGRRIIMHVGRVSFEKHVDDIVRCLGLLDDDVSLVIVGDGPARETVEEAVKECGFEDRVRFTGFVNRADLPRYYSIADVCVSSSRFETQGLTTMEAMACRKPIVCPEARAFTEIIHNGVDGFMFTGGIEDMADAINRALNCDDSVKEAAMERARSFSELNCAKMLEAMYEDVIKAKKERLSKKK